MKSFRVAAAQMNSARSMDANVKRIGELARQATRRRADALLFPECVVTGYAIDFAKVDREKIGAALKEIAETAASCRINLIVGTPLFVGRKIFNALVVFDRQGKPVHAYAKCQLTDSDRKVFAPGNAVSLFEIDGVKMTSIICHERRYPELVRLAAMAGAKVVFHPNAGLDSLTVSRRKHGGCDGIAVRAFENAMHYVFANTVGAQGKGKWSAGDSKIVAASDLVLALADNKTESVIAATLDLAKATRKYAEDSLRHPAFLSPDWKAMVEKVKNQA